MKISESLSYNGRGSFRPKPQIYTEESLNLMGVSFSWGDMDLNEKIFENIRYFVDAFFNQSEITNPFGIDLGLSGLENALKSGCALANEVIFRQVNKNTLSTGAEFVVLVKKGKELAILQVGQPSVFLIRKSISIPVLSSCDDLSTTPKNGAFLPSRLLGISTSCLAHIRTLRIEENDEILLLAHSLCPMNLFQNDSTSLRIHLKSTFHKISTEFPNSSFWISKINVF